MAQPLNAAILLIHCDDQRGIVRAVTEFIFTHNGNILQLDQHVDPGQKHFFMRVAWTLDDFMLKRDEIDTAFREAVGETTSGRPGPSAFVHLKSTKEPRIAVDYACCSGTR